MAPPTQGIEIVCRKADALSAAERKWGKAGGLKFRFFPCHFLPPLPAKALLPSSAWVFFAVFFFVFFAGRFFAGLAPDEALAEPT
jgi:hypothetical protein